MRADDETPRRQRDLLERQRAQETLRLLDSAVTQSREAILITDAQLDRPGPTIVFVNNAFTRMTGYSAEEAVGNTPRMLQGPLTEPAVVARLRAELAAGGVFDGETINYRKDGSTYVQNWQVSPILDAAGTTTHYIATMRDVTERVRSEQRMVRLSRVRALTAGINSLVVRVSGRSELLEGVCRIAVEKGGFAVAWVGMVEQGVIQSPMAAWHGGTEAYRGQLEAKVASDPAQFNPLLEAIGHGRPWVINDLEAIKGMPLGLEALAIGMRARVALPLRIEGRVVAVFGLGSARVGIFDEEEQSLLMEMADDISFALDHIGKTEQLAFLNYYDPLTGLANRRLFLDRLAQHMRGAAIGGRKLALVVFDIERFKNINESLGRDVGDRLLRHVARWMEQTMGDSNPLGRIEADHFALILADAEHEDGVARFLQAARTSFLEAPFRAGDAEVRVTAKVGVAMFPNDGTDAETLFRHAEAALKKAKTSNERIMFYTQAMTDRVAGQLALENKMRLALERNEFVLHYQPKLNVESGRLCGFEALIRWNDPGTGLVPPASFIPLLEETGLIHEVGRWALESAVDDLLRWRAAGFRVPRVAVNVSPLQLRDRRFVADVQRLLERGADVASGLEFEITEGMIMEDVAHSIHCLSALRAIGVTIAIDDFGTGFSSLGYLAKLPVDALKIDRLFIEDMMASPEGLALVSTIITLAHSLKLRVVAEGVETHDQSRLLGLLSCDELQGYLISKPLPAADFESRFLGSAESHTRV